MAFAPQVFMKQMVKIDATLFVDCMHRRVLYFELQKRGGGSSVFRLNGDGAVYAVLQPIAQTLMKLDWRSL